MFVQWETLVRFECDVDASDRSEADRLSRERLNSLPAMTVVSPQGQPVEGVHIADDWRCTWLE